MTIKLQIEAKIFKNIFKVVGSILEETLILFNKDGMEIKGINDGRITLIYLKLESSDMDKYEIDEEFKFGMNISDLNKVLGKTRPNEVLTVTHKDGDQHLRLTFKVPDKKKRWVKITGIDLEGSGVMTDELFKLEYVVKYTTTPAELKQYIGMAELYGETIDFKIGEENVVFSGNVLGEYTEELDSENLSEYDGEPFSVTYPLSELKNLISISAIVNEIIVNLKDGLPLRMDGLFGASSKIHFWLAPRVVEPEEDYDEKY